MQSKPDKTVVEVWSRSTIRARRPFRPVIHDTLPSRPPAMLDPLDCTMESSTEIELCPRRLTALPQPVGALPCLAVEDHFWEDATKILAATYKDPSTERWHPRRDHLLAALVNEAAPAPAKRSQPSGEALTWLRLVVISGSCVAVLVLAIILYSIVVLW